MTTEKASEARTWYPGQNRSGASQVEWFAVVGVVLALVFVLSLWPLQSYFEARAYERVTGKRVSTWDAMFLDLRVQEAVK